MGFIHVAHLKWDKSAGIKEVKAKLLNHRRVLEDRSYVVTQTHYDGELDTSSGAEQVIEDYPQLIIHPPDQHVGIAERSVRTVKDILRCFVLACPYLPWYGRFLVEAVVSVGFYANLRYPRSAPGAPTPLQQITGRPIIFAKDIPAAFGDIVMVEVIVQQNRKNTNVARMEEAVFLRPTMDQHGSSVVILLRSCEVVKRTNIRRGAVWNEALLDKLKKWAGSPRTDVQEVMVKNRKGEDERRIRELEPDIEPEFDHYVTVGNFEVPAYTRHQAGVDAPNADEISSSGEERSGPALPTPSAPDREERSGSASPTPSASEESHKYPVYTGYL
jgi:hypothetical protein